MKTTSDGSILRASDRRVAHVYPAKYVTRNAFLADRWRMNTALQITSCAFLLMTLLVYACLPSLQNLHGKTLMCHVTSLLLAFICLPIITWIMPGDATEERSTTTCKALGLYADVLENIHIRTALKKRKKQGKMFF